MYSAGEAGPAALLSIEGRGVVGDVGVRSEVSFASYAEVARLLL